MEPKRFQYTFPTKSGHSIAVNADSHEEALRGVNEALIVNPNLCEMKEIKMPRADVVIVQALADSGAATYEGDAKFILDALHAAGFHITEPSDKVFNHPDPLRDVFAGQAMARYQASGTLGSADCFAKASYEIADAMMKEREK
jgi:hypothetical protein